MKASTTFKASWSGSSQYWSARWWIWAIKRWAARVAGEEFQNILAHDAHELTTEELEQVEIVIRNASDEEYFSLSSSHTEDINGKRILIVEGVWKTSGLADYGLFIDSDNTGSAVQEIHFLAPERDYVNYIDQIEQVLASIVWK
jgi:hypothetical protein